MLHQLYSQLLKPDEVEKFVQEAESAQWYEPWTLYHYSDFFSSDGGNPLNSEFGQQMMDRLALQKLNPGNGNILLMYEYLQGIATVELLPHGSGALELAENIRTARNNSLREITDSPKLQKACHLGSLPRLQLQAWAITEIAKKGESLKDAEKAWWVFFLCVTEAVGIALRPDRDENDVRAAESFLAALPELRKRGLLKPTPHPLATTDPNYRGHFVYAAQNLPITSAGSEDDSRAKEFTRNCLITCRKFLAHLVSEDEVFCERYGSDSPPPVISNDNIVMLDTESMSTAT